MSYFAIIGLTQISNWLNGFLFRPFVVLSQVLAKYYVKDRFESLRDLIGIVGNKARLNIAW